MIDTDKTAQERERFEAWEWMAPSDPVQHDVSVAAAWSAWQARAALDTGGAQDSAILRMRERIASLREHHRRKMNAAADAATALPDQRPSCGLLRTDFSRVPGRGAPLVRE